MRPKTTHRPFSKRHQKALDTNTLKIELSERTRVRVWKTMCKYDYPLRYQPDPYDNWTVNSSGLRELPDELERIYGVDQLTACDKDERDPIDDVLEPFLVTCTGAEVFDVVELFYADMWDCRHNFQRTLNEAMQEEAVHWILCDGFFLKLDSQWVEEHVMSQAHELLGKGKYDGALDELREARSYLAAEDYKNAVHTAAKSMESLLKAILGREDGNASVLIRALRETEFYNELPEPFTKAFGENVLMALPFTRNKLGGHGQGKDVVSVPRSFAELAVNLAGTFAVFLVKRHLEVEPGVEVELEGRNADETEALPSDDIPF